MFRPTGDPRGVSADPRPVATKRQLPNKLNARAEPPESLHATFSEGAVCWVDAEPTGGPPLKRATLTTLPTDKDSMDGENPQGIRGRGKLDGRLDRPGRFLRGTRNKLGHCRKGRKRETVMRILDLPANSRVSSGANGESKPPAATKRMRNSDHVGNAHPGEQTMLELADTDMLELVALSWKTGVKNKWGVLDAELIHAEGPLPASGAQKISGSALLANEELGRKREALRASRWVDQNWSEHHSFGTAPEAAVYWRASGTRWGLTRERNNDGAPVVESRRVATGSLGPDLETERGSTFWLRHRRLRASCRRAGCISQSPF